MASLCQPFWLRTTGARTRNRVPGSRPNIWSTICSLDCPSIGRPQIQQWGCPIRAYNRRR